MVLDVPSSHVQVAERAPLTPVFENVVLTETTVPTAFGSMGVPEIGLTVSDALAMLSLTVPLASL